MMVLDEPTSAIDPIEETKYYHDFEDYYKGKNYPQTGAARIADRVIVLNKGEVAETRTHRELMEGGLYYQIYTVQSKWFQ